MIVVVKKNNFKKIAMKTISLLVVGGMLTAYYFHMNGKFSLESSEEDKIAQEEANLPSQEKLARKLEKIIYKESENVVAMIGQTNVQKIRIVGKTLFIVCDSDTDIEPLMVRYGALALVKNTNKDIKIAIDLQNIVGEMDES